MIRLLALAALFASAPVFAQEDAADTTAPTEQFAPAPSKSVEKHGVDTTGPGFRTMRFGLELVGGGVTGVAVATGFTLLSCAVAPADGWCVMGGIIFGGMLGMAVGFPVGTWTVGHLLDGTGSIWATLGAGVVGTVVGVYLLRDIMRYPSNGVAATIGLALPLVLSAVAYEVTSPHSRADSEARSRTSWMIAPSVGPKSAGVAFAMAF